MKKMMWLGMILGVLLAMSACGDDEDTTRDAVVSVYVTNNDGSVAANTPVRFYDETKAVLFAENRNTEPNAIVVTDAKGIARFAFGRADWFPAGQATRQPTFAVVVNAGNYWSVSRTLKAGQQLSLQLKLTNSID